VLVGLVPATRDRPRSLLAGALVSVAVVVVGMSVRDGVGEGVQTSFVVVTTIVVAVFLLGWRAVAALVARRRVGPAAQAQV
jgi:predicted permease